MSEQTLRRLLLSLLFVVIFMMSVGAITRLTGSGLSIPEWPLINGTLMYPSSDADWSAVFETYKKYPQYHLINKGMSVEEFKWIFFFEYFHRSITSLVSLFLFIITIGAFINKSVWANIKKNIISLFFLLLVQAFAGYYMVKSGLNEGMVSVSQYRLLIHLGLAALFLSTIFWTYLKLCYTKKKTNQTTDLMMLSKVAIISVFIQILSGALMAGTKAGFHFSDWPLMNGELIPSFFSLSGVYESNPLLNFTENIVTIHFLHRIIAYGLLLFLIVFYMKLKKANYLASYTYKYLPVILIIQVCLGILTLVLHVPIALATMHQLMAIFLLLQTILIRFAVHYETTN
jgi:cytochrome c oxidase assembly protein subunit 15